MTSLTNTTLLRELNLSDIRVRKAIAEMLPRSLWSQCADRGAVPVDLIETAAGEVRAGTVADLVLALSVLLTDGRVAHQVDIDTSAVHLVPTTFDGEASGDSQWARLSFDLGRPDWTVVVSLQALREEPEPRTEGVLRILVRTGLDFRGWLADEQTRAILHGWYVQYQVGGTLHSERQLAELHEELSWIEEQEVFVFASQLAPDDPAAASWQLQAIREAGGALAWAHQLWEFRDRPRILTASGSWEREEVIAELATGAEQLLIRAAERGYSY